MPTPVPNSKNPDLLSTPLDRLVRRAHARFIGPGGFWIVLLNWAGYAAAMLILGPYLAVSANYIIIIPVIVSAIAYGFTGGLIAGAMGLPANLLMFAILGHPEFSPASKPIAELSGIVIGSALGYLSDFYRRLETERVLRKEIEEELRRALRDKEALFRELHHRVKNNLNLVKSLIGLQSRRSSNSEFKRAAADLAGRIMSLSLVHEQLYKKAELSAVAIDDYLAQLIRLVSDGMADPNTQATMSTKLPKLELTMDMAIPLGLILNEALTNAFKHGGRNRPTLAVDVRFAHDDGLYTLEVEDDGPGMSPADPLDIPQGVGLGMTLIELLTDQLAGQSQYRRKGDRTLFSLSFPGKSGAGRPGPTPGKQTANRASGRTQA
ncbi:MAG: sensor histidine kinase [Spirochaetales bacterium]|nr:sensor histidine kinase [Spirochaetales bacterium]